MARDEGTTTDDDEEFHWDWDMVQLMVMVALIIISSIPYFIGYIKEPPEGAAKGRKGSGKTRTD